MKPITKEDVKFTIKVDFDDLPIRGNAMASGDDAFDKQVEDDILDRLECGDVWAWAQVEVKGTYKSLTASAFLGACCYEDQQDFKDSGYYDDMCVEVLDELNKQLSELIQDRT